MKKRGQVTIFIIIGLLIVLSGLLTFYARQTYLEKVVEPQIYKGQSAMQRLDSLNSYVKSCIDYVTPEAIKEFASNRLYLLADKENRIYYNGYELPVLCTLTRDKGCIQHPIYKEDLELELKDLITQNLVSCIDLNKFEKQGYELEYDPLKINTRVTIAKEDVSVFIEYPITLKSEEQTLAVSQFSKKVELPLGRMHNLATELTNAIAREELIIKQYWIDEIVIEQHKPYPDTVYILKKDNLQLRFAIKGLDTVGSSHIRSIKQLGCCQDKNLCYENVEEESCTNRTYDDDPTCVCSKQEQPQKGCCVSGLQCSLTTEQECNGEFWAGDCSEQNCANLHCGNGHKHGDSWCMYEPITGSGLDFVGSRHYVHSCYFGEIIKEECRDYREEICLQDDNTAICRPNRWQDCSRCEDKNCCENTNLRDCSWNNNHCVPQVPPGFKFWETGHDIICNLAPKAQNINTNALLCAMQGDCGNYRNIAGKYTYNGFKDTKGRESYDIYKTDPIKDLSQSTILNLPLYKRQQAELGTTSQPQQASSTAVDLVDFLQTLVKYEDNESQPYGSSSCSLWTTPTTSRCDLCDEGGRVCSEYLCKSLGENCIYTETRGIAICNKPHTLDRTPPTILIDEKALSLNMNATNTNMLTWYQGFEVQPKIKPYQPTTIGIKTSEQTRCKLTYLPTEDFNALPPIWFGSNEYSYTHNFTMRLPKEITIPQSFYIQHNISNVSGILEIPGFLKNSELALAALKILDDFQQQKFYLFVLCTDKSGNTNTDRFFITFSLDTEQDTTPPEILATTPTQNAQISSTKQTIDLKIYINEPAECKLDAEDKPYEQMTQDLDCETREYFMSPIAGGSYGCTTTTPFAENYFIRCKDNPVPINTYELTLKQNPVFNTTENLENSFLIENNLHIENIKLLQLENTIIETPQDLTLLFNTDVPLLCTYKENKSITCTDQCEIPLEIAQQETEYSIKCVDTAKLAQQNTNNQSHVLSFTKSEGLKITRTEPSGEIHQTNTILTVETSGNMAEDDIICNYKQDNEFYALEKVNNQFTKQLTDLEENTAYTYQIKCQDKYNNLAEDEIVFSVII